MEVVDPAHWNTFVQVGAPILGLMLFGNITFALRMLAKLDRIDETVTSTFPVYNTRLQAVEGAAIKLASDLKEVGGLRERIAVLEYSSGVKRAIQP